MFKIFHDTESLQNEITAPYMEELTKRFLEYVKVSKTFIVEEKYIDKEWREEYSILYSFSSYEGISSLTKRLHFFRTQIADFEQVRKVDKTDYLGYVVFRPIPPNRILKAMLKPVKETFGIEEGARFFMPLCKVATHIGAEEFQIEVFPFYSQDSMVTVCAHASMFMNCLYLSRRYGGSRPSLRFRETYSSDLWAKYAF